MTGASAKRTRRARPEGRASGPSRAPCRRSTTCRSRCDRGEVLAIVGESGSGKSVSAMTLMGLTRSPNADISGTATLADGTELIHAGDNELRRIRGKRISMIFQDPMSALTPVYRVGYQIAEQIRAHEKVSKAAARARAVDLLTQVGIPRAAERARAFPHQFSGGMRQRVMIAMALSCSPEILIADEPTTALDVTIQAQILGEIEDLRAETGVAVLLITHDLGVVAEVASRVVVMYAGRVVEQAELRDSVQGPDASLHLGSARFGAPDRPRTAEPAADDLRLAAVVAQPARRLPLHHPLPAPDADLRDRTGAARRRSGSRPSGPVPPRARRPSARCGWWTARSACPALAGRPPDDRDRSEIGLTEPGTATRRCSSSSTCGCGSPSAAVPSAVGRDSCGPSTT